MESAVARTLLFAFDLWRLLGLLWLMTGCWATICTCPRNQFACAPTSRGECTCIPENWHCDGDNDCGDQSDEKGCKLPTCSELQFACANGRCLDLLLRCDGDNDCGDDSDELDCAPRNCTDEEFKCTNGNCIRKQWRCDGDDDCKDNSDEECAWKTCEPSEFRCEDGTCIPATWQCDQDIDCSDGGDEGDCTLEDVRCQNNEFRCDYARCISSVFRCDGDDDCGDWSDEEGCEEQPECRHGEFRCDSGLCINSAWKCDGDYDCEDFSDEKNCPVFQCTSNQFQCKSGRCIERSWQCDGDDDCSDNSDEENCEHKVICQPGQFRCGDGTCIGQLHTCDKKFDCPDHSDEAPLKRCYFNFTCDEDEEQCEHLCLSGDEGDHCGCKPGFELIEDGKKCKDIDECQQDGICSQDCHNSLGSFYCTCASGYKLKGDKRGCKAVGPAASLLFANRIDIRRVTPDKMEYTYVINGLENAIALDFHHSKGYIFWSDITLDTIKRAYLNGSGAVDIVTSGLESPGGIAVDWIGDKLFWTDAATSRIEVANLDGSSRKCLLWRNLEKPRAIAVHPEQGTIFWTDWGSQPRIERAAMDGSERRMIADTSLFWPNGLTIDYAGKRIYWADAKHHVIESAELDGAKRKKIIDQGLPHPFAITLFEDNVFWTDWHTKSISKANKFTGNKIETVHAHLHFPMDIHTFHPQRQPPIPRYHCNEDNSGCSHLCLPNSTSFSCACPTGFKLLSDNKFCSSLLETFLVFTRRSDIRRISLDVDDWADVVIPLHDVSSAVAVDWDSQNDYIYWSDVTKDTINRAKWDGFGQEVVIGTNLESPAGLAVDWVTHKLYWTDAGTDRIEVANLDGTMRNILIWENLDRPRDIIVDPIGGFMYWTDWGLSPKIERAGMDGSMRTVLIGHNLTWPNGLAIDYENEKLYWADAGMKTIEYSDLNGQNRKVLIAVDLPHPFGLTLHEDRVFWTDWDGQNIQSADKVHGDQRAVVRSGLDNLMDIHVFHRGRQPVPSLCHSHNGGCSHLCLLAPLPGGHRCSCPIGINLMADGRTCTEGMQNFLIFARRTDLRKVSLDVPYFADVVLPISHLKNAIAVDVDLQEKNIYWSDSVLDRIQRASLDGTKVEDVVSKGLDTTDGLAIDSTGRKLYWTDTGNNRIEVAEMDGRHRKVLIWENLDSPRALALHYDIGAMYWTDWGDQPRIERADMDGSQRLLIISDGLGWPNGLAIDRPGSKLIWADAKTNVIEMSDLKGHHRRVLVSNVPHPYGLTVSGNHVYWTDWETQAVHRANKNSGSNSELVRDKLAGLMDIHAIQIDETGVNRCGIDNGGCSHLCLRNSRGYACMCPTGIMLQPDGKTCEEGAQTFLLFASRGSIRQISLDTADNTDVFLPIPDVHNAIAIDFHFAKRQIYFTDVYLDVIRRANMDGSNLETIVDKDLTTADGIAVDWVANNLYWTDTGRNVIEVSRLDGSSRKKIISTGLDEPRAIVLFPRKGYLFWSDWGNIPKIERSFLDGSSRKVIIGTDLVWPNGLTIDHDARRLYWADAQLDRIETSDLNGRYRVQLVQMVTHPFGLAQYGQHLYWTDWQTRSIERVDKDTGKHRFTVQSNIEGLMEVRIVSASRQQGSNPCSFQNGGCSHLCLYRPVGHICACPSYPDDRPCNSDRNWTRSSSSDWLPRRCSEADAYSGRCHIVSIPVQEPSIHSTYVVLTVVLVTISILLGIAIFAWRRRRKRMLETSESTLTFSNPTYSASSGDVTLERRSSPWRRLRNPRNEGNTFNLSREDKLNNLEVAALVTKKVDNSESGSQRSLIPPQSSPSTDVTLSEEASGCAKTLSHRPVVTYSAIETDL